MSLTPDRKPGASDEEELILSTNASPSASQGSISYSGTAFVMRDGSGVFDPRSGGGGITEAQHEALDTLAHEVAETSYLEVTRSSGQVSNVTTWETAAKLKKIRESAVARSSNQVSIVVETQYDAAGAAIAGQILTHTVTRSGGQVASIATVQT
jgi:hypothetical protein